MPHEPDGTATQTSVRTTLKQTDLQLHPNNNYKFVSPAAIDKALKRVTNDSLSKGQFGTHIK